MRHLYDMGDKVFGPYGFYDAFSETDNRIRNVILPSTRADSRHD